jgi:predicted HicB family RNase H-like nuclease
MKTSELKAKAARYMKIVEWSDEDGCFVGSAPPLIGPCCHGKNEAKVYAQLCRIVEEWVEILETDGRELPEPLVAKKFSGKFVLRLEPALHRRLAAKAIASGESLNSYCVKTLVKA